MIDPKLAATIDALNLESDGDREKIYEGLLTGRAKKCNL